jgi:hypothetical protein
LPASARYLFLPGEAGALAGERGGEQPLDVVGDFVAGLSAGAGELGREPDDVGRARVHEEVEGVRPLAVVAWNMLIR